MKNQYLNKNYFVKTAKVFCTERGFQYTAPRHAVLKTVLASNQALGAYDIIEIIGDNRAGQNPKPPTIYRALDFWTKHGFIHKVESLNKYIVCCENGAHKNISVLICDKCGDVKEAHLSVEDLTIAKETKFTPKSLKTEVYGLCKECG